jgi:hypothetical protein
VTIALTSGETVAWWVALGAGLVVALVVWALLEIVRRTVHAVRRGVDDVLTIGGRLAQNTWTVQLLKTTHEQLAALLEELEQHGARAERSRG